VPTWPLKASQSAQNNPPNLEWLCKDVYRTSLDPAAERGDKNPWLVTLVGRFGTIYVHGRDVFGVEVVDARIASRIAAALGGATPFQRGHSFWCYLFPVARLGAVAAIVQPPKVRRMSTAARKRLAAIGQGTRFGPAGTALSPLSEDQDASERPEVAQGSSDAPGPSGAPLVAVDRQEKGGGQ
jgi:hypothetical protein